MDQPKTRLRQFIAGESESMLGVLRHYLFRAGLSGRGQSLEAAARELLQEVVVQALQHESRFQPTREPRAWLLGIAANLIKRRQREMFLREKREPLVRDLHSAIEGSLSDDELFDWMLSLTEQRPSEVLIQDGEVETLLAQVGPDDARILRLAILNGLDGDRLSKALGISPGAARVRLHRALNRLRVAVRREESHE